MMRKTISMKIKAGKIKRTGKSVREMTTAAGNAMKNGFYTEAIWLLSGIMEGRLKKLVILTEERNPGAAAGLEQLLKRIKLLQTRERNALLRNQFPNTLLNSMRDWKNNRNIMMKDMLLMHVSDERRERLARQGIGLLKELNKVYKHYKLAINEPAEDDTKLKGQLGEQPAPASKPDGNVNESFSQASG
jgi:hypothetical protein